VMAYAHPYGPLRDGKVMEALANPDAGLIAREFPIDLALGLHCTLDMLTKEDAGGDFDLNLQDYMRLLNLGFRAGVSGSTDFHLDQGRQPIGGLRTYAKAGSLHWNEISYAYREGRTFATNGPLLFLKVNGEEPGGTVRLKAAGKIRCIVDASSAWGIESATVWMNGEKVARIESRDGSAMNETLEIQFERSGWILATAEGPAAPEVMSTAEGRPVVPGQYAITSPIHIEVQGKPIQPKAEDAQYYIDWIDAVERGAKAKLRQEHQEEPGDFPVRVTERLERAKAHIALRMEGRLLLRD